MIVADIYNDLENTNYMRMDQTVKEYRQLSEKQETLASQLLIIRIVWWVLFLLKIF